MRKILGLAIAALLIVGVVAGGTWAFFSDTETSAGNTLAAGTLNLKADVADGGGTITGVVTPGGDGINEYIEFPTTLKPGDSGNVTFTCTNDNSGGSALDGTLTMIVMLNSDENDVVEPETAAGDSGDDDNGSDLDGELDEYLGVKVYDGTSYLMGSETAYEPISGLEAALEAVSPSLNAGDSIVYTLSWAIASDIKQTGADNLFDTGDAGETDVNDNVLQSDSLEINLVFKLNQQP